VSVYSAPDKDAEQSVLSTQDDDDEYDTNINNNVDSDHQEEQNGSHRNQKQGHEMDSKDSSSMIPMNSISNTNSKSNMHDSVGAKSGYGKASGKQNKHKTRASVTFQNFDFVSEDFVDS
jgi:hypothetical protein